MAEELYEYMIREAQKTVPVVEHGVFGADMKVSLVNGFKNPSSSIH